MPKKERKSICTHLLIFAARAGGPARRGRDRPRLLGAGPAAARRHGVGGGEAGRSAVAARAQRLFAGVAQPRAGGRVDPEDTALQVADGHAVIDAGYNKERGFKAVV